jgi:hypothetical protein
VVGRERRERGGGRRKEGKEEGREGRKGKKERRKGKKRNGNQLCAEEVKHFGYSYIVTTHSSEN